ncbi:MAG: 30S ribosomal protein S4 [Clostridia bacterium]|jgi:small subunit ribosomal protein S4|nr:30S ribosomal protein S4 [Clostridiaceae bacterium]
MARYTDASCRLCRREGEKLFLKGDRCYSDKCSVVKRPSAPGQHGSQRKKASEHGLQMREKQKAKRFYGILEKQFERYYEIAFNQKGVTGENLLKLLESRLDNVVYRMGIGASRAEARQIVNHGHIMVNGKVVNIPSYRTKPGDAIEVKDSSKGLTYFKNLIEAGNTRNLPSWLSFDMASLKGAVLAECPREEVDLNVQEQLIIEFYSKS